MNEPRRLRTLRQKRLREVGAAGQERLFASRAEVPGNDLRAETALRYLIGAGVGAVAVHAEKIELVARLDPSTVTSVTAKPPGDASVPDWVNDPAARAMLAGADDALQILRRALGLETRR